MKKQIILSAILAIVFLVTSISADSIKLKTAVKIDTLEIIGTPKKNNVIQLRVKFTAYVNANASIIINYTDDISPLENLNTEKQLKEKINLSIEANLERIYTLKVIGDGASQITVAVVLDNPIPGWTNNASRYLNIETLNDQYKIYDEKIVEQLDIKEIQSYFGVDPLLKEKKENLVTETTYNVSISGKIQFNDLNEPLPKLKGLYSNSVQLWFKNTNNPNDAYHPVYSQNCQGIRNVHYDILDANGNYNFNFSFNGNLSNYNQIVIYVSRSNSAIYMPIQQDGIRVWCNNSYSDWFSLSESPVTSFNGTNPNISISDFNKLVNSGIGA